MFQNTHTRTHTRIYFTGYTHTHTHTHTHTQRGTHSAVLHIIQHTRICTDTHTYTHTHTPHLVVLARDLVARALQHAEVRHHLVCLRARPVQLAVQLVHLPRAQKHRERTSMKMYVWEAEKLAFLFTFSRQHFFDIFGMRTDQVQTELYLMFLYHSMILKKA